MPNNKSELNAFYKKKSPECEEGLFSDSRHKYFDYLQDCGCSTENGWL